MKSSRFVVILSLFSLFFALPSLVSADYSNLSTTTSDSVGSSFNYIVQTLGTGLSGTLTQIDLNSSNPAFIFYGNRPGISLLECDDSTYGNFGSNGCRLVFSGTSEDFSQLFSSIQSFYPVSVTLDPTKYYFFGTSGNNIFNTLPIYYGSDTDVVDGSCYLFRSTLGIFIPCDHVADLYFSFHGITKTSGHNPVLIIPGVMGTDILKDNNKLWLDLDKMKSDLGDQFMDPLQFGDDLNPIDSNLVIGEVIKEATGTPAFIINYDYTKSLIDLLISQGYAEDTDLFLFPYDWRYNVISNVDNLKQKIQEIRAQTGSDKVDVIAHSTGGLILKKYIMDNPTDNHVNKAVFVGIPNTGAPKAIKVFLQGDGFGIPWLADGEMKKIAENLPVVYDLSPSQRYFDTKGSYVEIVDKSLIGTIIQDLDFNQANNFLINDHQLNSQGITNSKNLHTLDFDNFDLRTAGVDTYNIVGCKAGTVGKIIETRYHGLLSDTVDYNLSYVPGDGTVPLESATNLPVNSSNKYYALNTEHGKMLSDDGIRQQIVNLITGSSLSVSISRISQDITKCKLKGRAISIFSPLDIDIVDQNGKHAGKDNGGITNEIPNADFEIIGEHKFVYLPTDDGQTYTISLKGTGNGTFTLKDSEIIDNQILQTETYGDISVTTNLKGSLDIVNSTLSLDVNGDNITDFNLVGIPNSVVTMPYVFSGFLQPINDTKYHPDQSMSIFKTGSTVPVKFQLKNSNGEVIQVSSLPKWLQPVKLSTLNGAVTESTYAISGTTGSDFKWDSTSQQYIYNWSTKGLSSGYQYRLSVSLDDGNTYSVTVGLR